jgi:hypothetical protein
VRSLSYDELSCVVVLGAICVGAAVVGAILGFRRRAASWPTYFASAAVAFGCLAACTTVGVSWIGWSEYDRGVRASVESARGRGHEIRRSVRGDGTVVYEARNYVVPDGSFSVIANRSPFRPSWPFVAGCSSLCGVVSAFASSVTRSVARRSAGA